MNIGTLRSDNGGEYLFKEFRAYLKSKGHTSAVDSATFSGVAKRMNRTLMEMAWSIMAHARLPEKYWAEVVDEVSYIKICTSTSSINGYKTPYQAWNGEKPNIGHLKVFGCTQPDTQGQKLDKKAVKLRFVGYSIQSKGYRLVDKKTSQVYICRDVFINEEDFGHVYSKTKSM